MEVQTPSSTDEPIEREPLQIFRRKPDSDVVELNIARILDMTQDEIDDLGPRAQELVRDVHQAQRLSISLDRWQFSLSPTLCGTVAYPADEALADEVLRVLTAPAQAGS